MHNREEVNIVKLNPDCIRDILIYVEDNTGYSKNAVFRNVFYEMDDPTEFTLEHPSYALIEKYGSDVLYYHIDYCEKAGLIEDTINYADAFEVRDLTPFGHDFLSNIRDDSNWNRVKDISSSVGSKGLDALVQISSNVITTIIQSQFKL